MVLILYICLNSVYFIARLILLSMPFSSSDPNLAVTSNSLSGGILATVSEPRLKAVAQPGIDRIPIGVVGLNFGRHILLSELMSGAGAAYFEVGGICDMDPARLAAVAGEVEGIRGYASLDELLSDPGIPAIALFTKPSGRADLIRKIIRAGKDVITTKPFEVDAEEALSVLEEAGRLGRTVHINSPAPVLPPDLEQIFAWRDAYDLGEAVGCRADIWANYVEGADGSWLDDPEKCPVAPIFRLGIYMINDLVALFGGAGSVQVFSSRIATARPTPDVAQMGIQFKNGGLANIFAAFCINDGDHYRNGLAVNFRNGSIYRNCGPRRSREGGWSEMALVMNTKNGREVVEESVVRATGGYRWDLFHCAVKGHRVANEITPGHVVEGLKIIRAMAEAARSRCSVPVV